MDAQCGQQMIGEHGPITDKINEHEQTKQTNS